VDGDNSVIVADWLNHRIRKITPQGQVCTLAGTSEEGHQDGEGTDALFSYPCGLAVDGDDNIMVADTKNTVSARYPHRAMCPLWRALAHAAIETEKGPLLSSIGGLASRWMGTTTSSWLTVVTIVSAKSHCRVVCPLWRALSSRAIKMGMA
jgi:hypothetical protein